MIHSYKLQSLELLHNYPKYLVGVYSTIIYWLDQYFENNPLEMEITCTH